MVSPLVSVIIPVYNGEKYVKETLQSVLVQSYSNIEIIVIDDGSIDSSASVVTGLENDRIRYVYQCNAGVSAARNHGVIVAKGDYIAFIDADDLWHPDKLTLQIAFLEANLDCPIAYSNRETFADSKELIFSENIVDAFEKQVLFLTLLKHNHIHCSSVVVRKQALIKIGLFDTMLAASEDSDLWIRAANLGKFGYINSVLSFYRRHDTNTINSIKFRRNRVYAERMLLARWFDNTEARGLLKDNLKGNCHSLAYEEEQEGNISAALSYFIFALLAGKVNLRIMIKICILYIKCKLT